MVFPNAVQYSILEPSLLDSRRAIVRTIGKLPYLKTKFRDRLHIHEATDIRYCNPKLCKAFFKPDLLTYQSLSAVTEGLLFLNINCIPWNKERNIIHNVVVTELGSLD